MCALVGGTVRAARWTSGGDRAPRPHGSRPSSGVGVWDGFPWALLGYSQIRWLAIAQLASVTGVYGLSFLLALTGAAAAT